jgi:hypothetical protein
MPAVGGASMTTNIIFREKDILVRVIVVKAETPYCTVSLNYVRKRILIYTHPEDKYNTLFQNTHQEEP